MGGICDKHGHLLTSRQKTYNFLAQKWRADEVGRWGRIGEVGRWAGTAGYGRLAGWQVGESSFEYSRVGVGFLLAPWVMLGQWYTWRYWAQDTPPLGPEP